MARRRARAACDGLRAALTTYGAPQQILTDYGKIERFRSTLRAEFLSSGPAVELKFAPSTVDAQRNGAHCQEFAATCEEFAATCEETAGTCEWDCGGL